MFYWEFDLNSIVSLNRWATTHKCFGLIRIDWDAVIPTSLMGSGTGSYIFVTMDQLEILLRLQCMSEVNPALPVLKDPIVPHSTPAFAQVR